jgi:hypothetical protein
MTRSAESYENEIRYWKHMAYSLNQRIQAQQNTPEAHDGSRGLQKDPTGNRASARADRQRKKRN